MTNSYFVIIKETKSKESLKEDMDFILSKLVK